MPQTLLQLSGELSKQASKTALQDSLPIVLRPLPSAAIKAGEKIAGLTGGRNIIEERLLGAEAVTVLGPPSDPASFSMAAKSIPALTSTTAMMCGTCRAQGTRPDVFNSPRFCDKTHQLAGMMNRAAASLAVDSASMTATRL